MRERDDVGSAPAAIAAGLAAVRARIDRACARVGRDSAGVRLLPVTKTLAPERVRAAFAVGVREVGENKVQEAVDKAEALDDLPLRWSIIGHLQTNKAKYVARFACEFQSLDSMRIAEALERRLQIEGRGLDVFIQVNTSGEASKYGLEPASVLDFARSLTSFPALRVRGLMTLAVFSSDESRVRACFQALRSLRTQLQDDDSARFDEAQLSMGMSSDFEIAVEEGATIVRVGQAIFGPRPLPHSYYWPTT